ncbi:MAG: RNA methyltransferase [Vicinamibacteria bacterium]|nr:RNA methyltransferase [Vicinamibacteria bacterium]
MSTPPPKRISARDNPEFKRFLAVRARKNRDFVLVEGPKLLEEAVRSGLAVKALAIEALPPFPLPPGAALVHFAPPLMKSLSDVETHQGSIALVERPRFADDWIAAPRAFILVLDGLQDPGNVGTLFRTAEAAGVSGVLLTRGCADPLSPKALRASAGSAFRMPHIVDLGVEDLPRRLPRGVPLAAAVAGPGALSVFDAEALTLPMALALGSEGSGLDPSIEAAASRRIRVPSARDVESLNVAAAGAIVMFEIARRAGILAA